METYQKISDETMEALFERLEEALDSNHNPGFEVEYSVSSAYTLCRLYTLTHCDIQSGVLTLNMRESGTYVINKQPPNKQIWLSSPIRHDSFCPDVLFCTHAAPVDQNGTTMISCEK